MVKKYMKTYSNSIIMRKMKIEGLSDQSAPIRLAKFNKSGWFQVSGRRWEIDNPRYCCKEYKLHSVMESSLEVLRAIH